MSTSPYAPPRDIQSLEECYFYHTMDIPGYGTVEGAWDLRGREDKYLGGVDVRGKRVLELGTASGCICYYMESRGAEVVGYDLSENQSWDLVPHRAHIEEAEFARFRQHIRHLNNGWWLAHRVFRSKARVAYGAVYDLPAELGRFDMCTFGSILLHLRDPLLALERAAALVTDTIVVTDRLPPTLPDGLSVSQARDERMAFFFPRADTLELYTWWFLTPGLLVEFVKILGFEDTTVTYHTQLGHGQEIDLFTVVGRRRT